MKDSIDRLIRGELPCLLIGEEHFPEAPLLLPGSFNPLHEGHIQLLHAAERITQRPGMFELSVINVDKPPLDPHEIRHRLQPMTGRFGVVLTRAPTFLEKAALFPGAWFAMGFDTVIRLLSPEYHADVPAMLSRFAGWGTRFVVAGRLHQDGFLTVEQLDVPAGFEELFIPVPEALFREDISSTALRAEKRRDGR